MTSRKYITEFGLHIVSDNEVLYYPKDLNKFEPRTNAKYHIYMIHKTPKITIDNQSIKLNHDRIELALKFQNKTQFDYEKIHFKISDAINHTNIKVDCPYPYNHIHLKSFSEKVDLQINSLYLTKLMTRPIDLEVLYIGQSYGEKGERLAMERLSSHSTLQKILSDIVINEPDKDILVSLWDFVPKLLPTINGIDNAFQTTTEEDEEHFMRIISNPFDFKQMINITEAALINYFKPIYNEKFISNFPDISHSSYKEYYDLDFNALIVELWQENLNARLFTQNNEYQIYEFIQYQLHPKNIRKSMFDIFE